MFPPSMQQNPPSINILNSHHSLSSLHTTLKSYPPPKLNMLSPPDSPKHTTNPLSHLTNSIASYDGNVMLAAVISLLLVILFVLLLHVYAKWFLAQARHRRQTSMSVSHVLRPARFHHFHSFTFDTTTTTLSSSPSKGLEAAIISSIPLFVYKVEEQKQGLECVICLSPFEENDVGRNLPKCGHAFHVECIDMWLHSHSSCPICRAPVVGDNNVANVNFVVINNDVNSVESGGESLEVVSSELGVSDGESRLEMVRDHVSNCESRQDVVVNDSLSASSSSSSTLSSSLGCSLKRMLSRNRSERKVFPSSNVSELDV